MGFHGTPSWWAIPLTSVASILVSLCIIHLPGTFGHEPAEGLKTGGPQLPASPPSAPCSASPWWEPSC